MRQTTRTREMGCIPQDDTFGARLALLRQAMGWSNVQEAAEACEDRVGKVLARLLGQGWSAHTLRHAAASRWYAVERDLRAVQELLGHSKPETTARYTAVPGDARRAAVCGVDLVC